MYAPRAFISMIAVLIVFAVAAYFMTGSLGQALVHTIICAVLLQVGYFIGVLYLVRREKSALGAADNQKNTVSKTSQDGSIREDVRPEAAARFGINDR